MQRLSNIDRENDSDEDTKVFTEVDSPLADHNRGYKYFDRDLYGRLTLSQKVAFFSQFQKTYAERVQIMRELQVSRRSTFDPEIQRQIDVQYHQYVDRNDGILRSYLANPDISICDLFTLIQ